ncbi:PilZ domain-containing protein [Planococcus kocurii]|uniref:PilZ domain-containing protein n=1 Tax=Planococcus kocurii TaxID=1374 RepID=A0ABN4JT12_9BACL|nr:PilZ domain-containing protein [Planococcus kocurii]ALS78033.1 hypothetical protein AUO94_04945 [Planococcus kocurii]
MFYKRLESFRYTFGAPPEIYLQLLDSNNKDALSQKVYCLLLDISPKGAKLFTEEELAARQKTARMKFILNHETITVDATIVWKQKYEEGWLYGADFERNTVKEMLILNEIRELKEIEMN